VHWIEFGTGGAAPPLVFVHGLGGSHLNWVLVGQQLADGRRAVALDLRGFGLTPGTRRTATVPGNVTLLDRFLREVTETPAILVGNSMGGLVSIMQAHANPGSVAGLVLVDPALPLPLRRPDLQVASQFLLGVTPGLGELHMAVLSRSSPRQAVRRIIALCFADPSRADPAMLSASVALAGHRQSMPGRDESFLAAMRSLMGVLAQRQRFWAMAAAIGVPVLLIGGDADRLVPVAAVRAAAARNPAWQSVILARAGHTPQLEDPAAVIAAVGGWLNTHFPPTTR
jgi:pimeloyl-ACP methyl ester carboxylesterase